MKTKIVDGIALTTLALMIFVAGCSVVGRNPSPPTKLEQSLFDVKTNYVPVVVPVTEYRTNLQIVTATVTNLQGVTQTVTNFLTNVVTTVLLQTNQQPAYAYAQGAGAQNVKDVAGTIGGLFGVGGLASTALGALLSVWGWARSSKNYQTASNTAQVVETLRQFIKQLPNGAAYDQALTTFMVQHQAEAGVLAQVVDILNKEVSNPDAQQASREIITALRALGVNVPTGPTQV
jgi:hypothetical protein